MCFNVTSVVAGGADDVDGFDAAAVGGGFMILCLNKKFEGFPKKREFFRCFMRLFVELSIRCFD